MKPMRARERDGLEACMGGVSLVNSPLQTWPFIVRELLDLNHKEHFVDGHNGSGKSIVFQSERGTLHLKHIANKDRV